MARRYQAQEPAHTNIGLDFVREPNGASEEGLTLSSFPRSIYETHFRKNPDVQILNSEEMLVAAFDAKPQPYVALVSSWVTPDEVRIAELARHMAESGAPVGIGALKLPSGRLLLPPARIEDVRFREVAATGVMVMSREHWTMVCKTAAHSPHDPVRHWRMARSAIAAARTVRTDTPVGTARAEEVYAGTARIPIDLAGPEHTDRPRSDLILIYGEIDASVSLYFDGLPAALQERLRFLQPSHPIHDLPHLLASALVIIVRGFEYLAKSGALDLLDVMQVPYAWFVDDNIMKLAEDQEGFSFYSRERIASFLARAQGVLASTKALADAMTGFGRPVTEWPCVFDDSVASRNLPDRSCDEPLVLGTIGGSFRRKGLTDIVLPAIERLDPKRRIKVYARFDLVIGLTNPRMRSVQFEPSFRQFVYLWRGFNCDVVVHPPGHAANMPFKGAATLLAARYLGAVPVVMDEPAYTGLGVSQGVCLAGPDTDSWVGQLRGLCDVGRRRDLFACLDRWCRETFSPAAVPDRMGSIEGWSTPASVHERDRRLRRALATCRFPDLVPGAPDGHLMPDVSDERSPLPEPSAIASFTHRLEWRVRRGAAAVWTRITRR